MGSTKIRVAGSRFERFHTPHKLTQFDKMLSHEFAVPIELCREPFPTTAARNERALLACSDANHDQCQANSHQRTLNRGPRGILDVTDVHTEEIDGKNDETAFLSCRFQDLTSTVANGLSAGPETTEVSTSLRNCATTPPTLAGSTSLQVYAGTNSMLKKKASAALGCTHFPQPDGPVMCVNSLGIESRRQHESNEPIRAPTGEIVQRSVLSLHVPRDDSKFTLRKLVHELLPTMSSRRTCVGRSTSSYPIVNDVNSDAPARLHLWGTGQQSFQSLLPCGNKSTTSSSRRYALSTTPKARVSDVYMSYIRADPKGIGLAPSSNDAERRIDSTQLDEATRSDFTKALRERNLVPSDVGAILGLTIASGISTFVSCGPYTGLHQNTLARDVVAAVCAASTDIPANLIWIRGGVY